LKETNPSKRREISLASPCMLTLCLQKIFMRTFHNLQKEYKLKIGANVRKWRNLKSIKQKQLALALNLSEAAVSNIENDITNINLRQLEDIANAIEVPVHQLLNDPEESYSLLQEEKLEGSRVFDKELLNAMICSLEKKDAQLEKIMENVISTMSRFVKEKTARV
jgi:transcriptional regulator with XRE-family HTH domain